MAKECNYTIDKLEKPAAEKIQKVSLFAKQQQKNEVVKTKKPRKKN